MHTVSADLSKRSIGLFLLFLLFIACEREPVVVPHALLGKWKTSAPEYADRYLKFDERTVIFGVGNGEEELHSIDALAMKQGAGETVYTFSYRDAEEERGSLVVFYRPDSGGALQLKNSPEVWKKISSGDAGR